MSVESVDIIRRVGRHLSCCAAQATRCRPACNIKQLCFNTEWQNTCNKGDYKGPVPDSASSPLGLQRDLPAPSWKKIAETLALTRRPDSLKGGGGQKQPRHSERRRSAWKWGGSAAHLPVNLNNFFPPPFVRRTKEKKTQQHIAGWCSWQRSELRGAAASWPRTVK